MNLKNGKLQPPSGGCVLKLARQVVVVEVDIAATFGWLCVETTASKLSAQVSGAATFGWLCVETSD